MWQGTGKQLLDTAQDIITSGYKFSITDTEYLETQLTLLGRGAVICVFYLIPICLDFVTMSPGMGGVFK